MAFPISKTAIQKILQDIPDDYDVVISFEDRSGLRNPSSKLCYDVKYTDQGIVTIHITKGA